MRKEWIKNIFVTLFRDYWYRFIFTVLGLCLMFCIRWDAVLDILRMVFADL